MEICQSKIDCRENKRVLFSKNGYPICECLKCRQRFVEISDEKTHLSEVYSDDYFFEGKDGYPNYLDEKDSLIKYGKHYAQIVKKHTKPGKVLDVGCAAGFILKGFEIMGWEGYGIEPNATMADYGKKELNLNIETGGFENYSTDIKFDLINFIQVIGHFYDIDKVMVNTSDLLNRHGLVLVESWNAKSFIAKILGKYWHEYSPPSVINWFSNESLIKLFNNYGFEIVDYGLPAKQINIKHALSLIGKNKPNNFFKRNLFGILSNSIGKIVVYYPPIDLKWYIFRKQ